LEEHANWLTEYAHLPLGAVAFFFLGGRTFVSPLLFVATFRYAFLAAASNGMDVLPSALVGLVAGIAATICLQRSNDFLGTVFGVLVGTFLAHTLVEYMKDAGMKQLLSTEVLLPFGLIEKAMKLEVASAVQLRDSLQQLMSPSASALVIVFLGMSFTVAGMLYFILSVVVMCIMGWAFSFQLQLDPSFVAIQNVLHPQMKEFASMLEEVTLGTFHKLSHLFQSGEVFGLISHSGSTIRKYILYDTSITIGILVQFAVTFLFIALGVLAARKLQRYTAFLFVSLIAINMGIKHFVLPRAQ
jgi:hypothetical protein